ncbi:hypothetical protein ACQ5SB_00070 [Stenotrophomonas geniculata]|uniref:hypothetical protein n=1 Tax=Stenotrophomonas TaxID=40323 RepID=UPI003D32DEFD
MADQLLTAAPVRNVTSARFIASPSSSVLAARFQCLLSCGHVVIRQGEHVRGTRFSLRAPHTATCNQCPKETTVHDGRRVIGATQSAVLLEQLEVHIEECKKP